MFERSEEMVGELMPWKQVLALFLLLTLFPLHSFGGWGRGGSDSVEELVEAAEVTASSAGGRVKVYFRPRKSAPNDEWPGHSLDTAVGKAKLISYHQIHKFRKPKVNEKWAESVAWRTRNLLRTERARTYIERLMKQNGGTVDVCIDYSADGKPLPPTNNPNVNRVFLFHEATGPYADYAYDDALLGITIHELAHTQDKNQRPRSEYGPDGQHDGDEITTKQMAFMEGWAEYNQALCDDMYWSEIRGYALMPHRTFKNKWKKERPHRPGSYQKISPQSLRYGDYIAQEAVIATMFICLDDYKGKNRRYIQKAFDETNDTNGDVIETIVAYAEASGDGYRAAAIFDYLTAFKAPLSVIEEIGDHGSRKYGANERNTNSTLWSRAKKRECPPSLFLDYLTNGTAIDDYIEEEWDGTYLVEVSKVLIDKVNGDGGRWDVRIPGTSDGVLCDPYVEVYVNGYKSPKPAMTTTVARDTVYHEWRQAQRVKASKSDKLAFMVWDKDAVNPDLIAECWTDKIENIKLGKKITFRDKASIVFLVVKVSKSNDLQAAGTVTLLSTEAK